jgi:hypothetical protein
MVYTGLRMKGCRRIVEIAAPLLLFAGTAPVHAQMPPPDRTDSVIDEVAAFERDVADAATTQRLTRKDSTYLRSRARAIRSFFNKVSKDGVSLAEAQLLRDRINFLRTRYGVTERPDF